MVHPGLAFLELSDRLLQSVGVKVTKKGLLSCAWTLRDSCSGEVESGDLLRKIVLERRARGRFCGGGRSLKTELA